MAPGPVEELALLDLERSNRGASKQRRDQINGEIATMRDLLPLQESARQRLSQLQIMSLSCVYIRKCNILQKMLPTNRCSIEVPCDFTSSLTGFILVTTRDGKLVYISENVTEYLGHSMVDMKTQGDSLFDIVDKRDHGTVQAQLLHGVAAADGQQGRRTSFFCRMNMSRTLKRQGGFGDVKVMHVKGHFVPVTAKEGNGAEQHVFMALCSPLITPDVKESLIQNNTMIFKSVHKLDMSFIEIAETGEHHIGLNTGQLHNRSWYSMLHPEDLTEARAKHIQLIKSRHEMGCMMTVRMITNSNEVIWVNIVMHVRQALLTNSDDPVIVCINQVVSEEEAKQFKIQGQLFALYAARAPDIFFGGHQLPQMHQTMDPEMMGRPHAQMFMRQQHDYFADQQRFQFGNPQQGQTMFPHQPNQYGILDTGLDISGQRLQGHTSTIKALKRKLQENFISSCKPTKLPRLSPSDGGCSDYPSAPETQYVMNVNVFRNSSGLNHGLNNGDVSAFTGSTIPMVYQSARNDPLHAIRNKNDLLVDAIASVGKPDVVQKLAPTCTLEQVVPEVLIPDCYLTPEPSPATSPKPLHSGVEVQQDVHEIKHLTTYVMDKLNEMKQCQVTSPSKETNKKKNLPVIDATFVDSFFDDLAPFSLHEKYINIKEEPLSPEPYETRPSTRHIYNRTQSESPTLITSSSPSPPPSCLPLPPSSNIMIKQELTYEDCSDLERLLGMVGTAGSDQSLTSSFSSTESSTSPVASPKSYCDNVSESYSSSFESPLSVENQKRSASDYHEMSPCSSSPGYDGRDDILDPDNWLLEPISLSLDMALPVLDALPCDIKPEVKNDDMYHLKQLLLQQSWTPCGALDSNQNTQ